MICRTRGFKVSVTFFEIYGGRCSDLLHGRAQVGWLLSLCPCARHGDMHCRCHTAPAERGVQPWHACGMVDR